MDSRWMIKNCHFEFYGYGNLMLTGHDYNFGQIPFSFFFLSFTMVQQIISNDQTKFASYEQDTVFTIICHVIRAYAVFLFTYVHYTCNNLFQADLPFLLLIFCRNKQFLIFNTFVLGIKLNCQFNIQNENKMLCLHSKAL